MHYTVYHRVTISIHKLDCILISEPTLTISPSDSTVMANTKLELTCQAPSRPQITYTYQFLCDTTTLNQQFQPSNTYTVTSATSSCSYTCKAKSNNGVEAVSGAHQVTVHGECVLCEIICLFPDQFVIHLTRSLFDYE